MIIVQWLKPVLLQVLLQALVPVHVMLIHGVDVVTNVWEMVLHKSFHIIMLFLSLMKQNDVKMAFAFSHRFLCGVGKNKLIGRALDVFLRKRGVTLMVIK